MRICSGVSLGFWTTVLNMLFLMSFLFPHAFTSYEEWESIVVGTTVSPMNFSIHTCESVTLQLSGTNFKIERNSAKSNGSTSDGCSLTPTWVPMNNRLLCSLEGAVKQHEDNDRGQGGGLPTPC